MQKLNERSPVTSKPSVGQDRAAGGEHLRKVKLPDGAVATASVSVQIFQKSAEQWGYLRFKTGGKTMNYYIGKVSADTLEESLAIGWRMVREKSVLERAGWSWVVSSPTGTSKERKKRPAADTAKR